MTSKEQIVVWVSPEGAITIDAIGFTGKSCEEATRFLEEGLGTVGRKQRSRDYYRSAKNNNLNQQEQKS